MITERVETLSPSIFRAYDIRGVVDKTLTEEGVFLIGKSIGSLVLERGETQLAIARDGRLSGPRLSKKLCQGILSVGCDVIDLGMVPTPLLYYAACVLDQHSGVMLTGSHNPADYNGIKTVLQGVALTDAEIQALYKRITDKRFYSGKGEYNELNVTERYIEHIQSDVKLARPLKIVIDGGNGVASELAPMLYRALGCDVQTLYCEIDGHFPNHHPDPSDPKNLQDLIKAVRESKADIGLAFDGDGDRLGVVTSDGDIIWPDRLLALFSQAVIADHPHAKIIFDVKCTNELPRVILKAGGEPIMWKTGHSLIKAKMQETQAKLAGEMSGHFFFKDRWYGFDDALYAGARLLEILSKQTKTSAALFATIPNSVNTPELKVAVTDEEKFDLMQQLIVGAKFAEKHDLTSIDGLRVNFADGWGLVRPSNTTPYLILRFEAVNEAMLKQIQTWFRDWMLSVKPDLVLPF